MKKYLTISLMVVLWFIVTGGSVFAADTLSISPEKGVSYNAQDDHYYFAADGVDEYTVTGTSSAGIVVDTTPSKTRDIIFNLENVTLSARVGIKNDNQGTTTFNLMGKNQIKSVGNSGIYGISCRGKAIINGPGSLDAIAMDSISIAGIQALDGLTINGGDIVSRGGTFGIVCSYGSASFTVNGGTLSVTSSPSSQFDGIGSAIMVGPEGTIQCKSGLRLLGLDPSGKNTLPTIISKIGSDDHGFNALTYENSDICFSCKLVSVGIMGDLNNNGKIDITDARKAKRAAMKTTALTAEELAAGDLDGDGKVTIMEARKIKRVAMKEITLD